MRHPELAEPTKFLLLSTSRTVYRRGENIAYRCQAVSPDGSNKTPPKTQIYLRGVENSEPEPANSREEQILRRRGRLPTGELLPGAYELDVRLPDESWLLVSAEVAVLDKDAYNELWLNLVEPTGDDPQPRLVVTELTDLARACLNVSLGDAATGGDIRVWLGVEDRTSRPGAFAPGVPSYEWILTQLIAAGHEMIYLGGRISIKIVMTDEQVITNVDVRAKDALDERPPAFLEFVWPVGLLRSGSRTARLTTNIRVIASSRDASITSRH